MYPDEWHQIYGDMTGNSARLILPRLIELFDVKSVIEVGCGAAHWTQAAVDAGATDYAVVDGPWNDRSKLLVDKGHFVEANLTVPLDLGRKFDLGLCLEVAEHVQGESADTLVDSLTRHTDVLLFGAAIPFQGGYGHINEQWPSWWREKLQARGYTAFDIVRPHHWLDKSIHYWYRQNAFVYVRSQNAGAMAKARAASEAGSILLFDAVHPEKFDEVASYKAIAGKRLAKRFPGWLTSRIRTRLSGNAE